MELETCRLICRSRQTPFFNAKCASCNKCQKSVMRLSFHYQRVLLGGFQQGRTAFG
jgi:hypothetical protein